MQGKDGEELLDILDDVEQFGDDKVIKQDLRELSTKYLKDNLGADIGTPIFAINLKGIKHRLEKNIWV